MRVTLIFNPSAGSRDTTSRLSAIHAACRDLGVDYELLMLAPERPAAWAAERVLADPPERVWVSGGDGTVREVGAALLHSNIPLAVLPGGTANAIARSTGVPSRTADAVRFAALEEPRPFDAVRVNGRISLLTAGVGYDSAVMATADAELKRRFGLLAYIYAALTQLGSTQTTEFEVEVDRRPAERIAGHCLLVANIGKLFGEFDLFPDSRPDDARMDIAVLTLADLNDFLALSGHVLQGTMEQHPGSRFLSGARVRVRLDRPLRSEVDGDVTGLTDHLEAEVLPGALRVVRLSEQRRGFLLPAWTKPAPRTS